MSSDAAALEVDRIRKRLLAQPVPLSEAVDLEPDWVPDIPFAEPPKPAAVLIAIIDRADEPTVVYTQRSANLRAHSAQIAFPGGKLDFDEEPPSIGALREAEEEIALEREKADVLGYMTPVFTGTNYLITPVVAHVRQTQPFVPNPGEVDDVFEVPLRLLASEKSYRRQQVNLRGRAGHTWRIDHQDHVIWGITANLTHQFYELALAG